MYDDSGLVSVLVASPGTPSALAGIQKGDVIQSIDGKSIADIGGLIKFREFMKGEVGTTYKLDLLREGKLLAVSLTLKDLFE